jgi:hypothetical protein
LRQPENGDGVHQLLGLGSHAAGCGGHFLHQRGILLGGLVHLHHRFAHLGDAIALFCAGRADFAHDVCHAPNGADHLVHGHPRLVDQCRALFHAGYAGRDELLDLFGGLGRAACQATHLARHHSESAALLACTGGFHGRVQRQDVGLEGDAIDHADDVCNLLRAVVDALHGLNHLRHHFAAFNGHGVCFGGQLVGSLCAV